MKMPHLSSVLALLVVIGPSRAEKPRPAADAPLVLGQFEVARDGRHLFVPVTLKGTKYLFIIDTGATLTIYDRSMPLGKAKGEVAMEAVDGRVQIPFYHPPDAAVGGLSLRSDSGFTVFRAFRRAGGGASCG
jgi:hypothetical protein